MKKLLLIATMALAATPAMASKARLTALANSAHLGDTRSVITNPGNIMKYGDWLTFEMGSTVAQNMNTAQTISSPRAEGGFTRGMGDSRFGFYLGNTPTWMYEFRQSGYLYDENPIMLMYGAKAGDLNWGAALLYSNSDIKSANRKQSATGLQAGVQADVWSAALTVGLANTYESTPTTGSKVEFKGTNAIDASAKYVMDTMTFHAQIYMNGGKETTAGVDTKDYKKTDYTVGVVNSMKSEGTDFFYGAKLLMSETKQDVATTSKTTYTKLPVHIGLEAPATSWMVIRGSVVQNFLLGSTKTETGGAGDADTITNDTTVNGGVGLTFGKLTVDGTLAAATSTTAALDGNSFMANAALTYKF